MRKRLLLLLLLTISTLQILHSQWNPDPNINTAISTGTIKSAMAPRIASDGRKGFYVAWQQTTTSGIIEFNIYLQHLNEMGFPTWQVNGIQVTDVVNTEIDPKVLNDGEGGAYVIWQDQRVTVQDNNIYAQRFDVNGNALWAINGIPVSTNTSLHDIDPEVIPDGAGGFIVCWRSHPQGGTVTDVYAQRVDRNGNKLWDPNGVPVCTAPEKQDYPTLVSDGNGGAIITWDDYRNIPASMGSDVYAQRITNNGVAAWTANGIAVCTTIDDQKDAQLTTDGNGGAIITWSDWRHRTPTNNVSDIYAQRINANGTIAWSVNGHAASAAGGIQKWPMITDDDNGGAIICFYDTQNPGQAAIYAQKLDATGIAKWPPDGVPASHYIGLSTGAGGYIVKDGGGGAIVAWQQQVNMPNGVETNIYAQHLTSIGMQEWGMTGLPVCTAPRSQVFTQQGSVVQHGWMIADEGFAVLTWEDHRNDGVDIYATKIYAKPPIPIILNVDDQCITSPTAIGKLSNPPLSATIQITQDGALLTYNPADSTFIYYTNGVSTGNHTVQVKYSNMAGSSEEETVYLVVDGINPTIEVSTFSTTICEGVPTDFITLVNEGGSNPEYQWQVNGVNVNSNSPRWRTSTLQDGDVVSCILTVDQTLSCATATTAISNTLTMTVTNQAPPTATVSVSDDDICKGTMTTFTVVSTNAGADPGYRWQVNGINAGTNSPTFSSSNLDDDDQVHCMIIPGVGACINSAIWSNTITMEVSDLPIVSLTPMDTLVKYNSQVTLNAAIIGSFQSYTWTPAAGLMNSSSLTPVSAPVTDDAEYVLTVTTDDGCTIVKKSSIKLLRGLYIPTGFTPNGDGLNDVFRIPPRTLQKLKRFSVYNRWGSLVFMTSDLGAGWDGSLKGSLADAGVYVYIIEGHDGVKNVYLKGTFTLVR